MKISLNDLGALLDAKVVGDGALMVSSISEPNMAGDGVLALAMDPKFSDKLKKSNAKMAILWADADWQSFGLRAALLVHRGRYAMSKLTKEFEITPDAPIGINSLAFVDPTAEIGKNVSIGPFTTVGAHVVIGDNARILSHVSIDKDAILGADALLFQGVRIGARIKIGNGFIAHANAVIGSDGFSFVTPELGSVEAARQTGDIGDTAKNNHYARIYSLGSVEIGDDVEIGATSCVDRGTVANTVIGSGTKIDNQVQIGHNVRIGRDCLLCGQSGVAGSTTIGDRVVVGGKTAIADHLTVGDDVVITGGSGVSANVPSGRIMMGNPAIKMDLAVESYKAYRRLPRMVKKLAEMEEMISKNK